MTDSPTAAALAALYAPGSDELLRTLPDIADGMRDRMHDLVRAPTLELAEQLMRDSAGLTTLAMKIATTMRREMERADAASFA